MGVRPLTGALRLDPASASIRRQRRTQEAARLPAIMRHQLYFRPAAVVRDRASDTAGRVLRFRAGAKDERSSQKVGMNQPSGGCGNYGDVVKHDPLRNAATAAVTPEAMR